MNVLFLAAEAEPYVKVGGLGDVAGALPRYIRELPQTVTGDVFPDVRLVLPMHSVLKPEKHGLRALTSFRLSTKDGHVNVNVFTGTLGSMPVYFLDAPPVSRSGSVYSSNPVMDGEKYTFFPLAALNLMRQLDWRPHVVHANDWHSALACYALLLARRQGDFGGAASVLTVHNLHYMGPEIAQNLSTYGLTEAKTGLPDWASQKPLPLGLWAADAIVAVSPTYAQEIQTAEFGNGLQDYLRARKESLNGILNGIDYESFNPALDPAIAQNFGIPTLERRLANKKDLLERLGFPGDSGVPLLGIVARMDPQKGIDLIPPALRRLRDLKWQVVILGTGLPKLERAVQRLQTEFPDRVRCAIKFDDILARQIYAGADLLLMPSRYEPCGLSQMIAMRYGCIPIVSAVGGLKDTVVDGETGFLLSKPTAVGLAAAVRRALSVFPDKTLWVTMQVAGMSQDFSMAASALQYFQLYQRILRHLSSA